LDSLAASSSAIAEAIDNLTTTLYAPQVVEKVMDALRVLQSAVRGLQDALYIAMGVGSQAPSASIQTLDASMSSMTIKESPVNSSRDVQWLVGCFSQIHKSIAAA
jgi:hypothetical protein